MLLCLLFLPALNAANVPLLAWSTDRPIEKAVSALQTISGNDVHDSYLKEDIQNAQTVVIFLQDKLSIEDFTIVHPSPFRNVEAHFTEAGGLYIPAVSDTGSLIDRAGTDRIVTTIHKTEELQLKSDQRNLVIVDFNNVGENRINQLKSNDEEFEKILSLVYEATPSHVVIYTGKQSYWKEPKKHLRVARQAPATDDKQDYIFVNSTCVMLYAEDIFVKVFRANGDMTNYKVALPYTGEQVTPTCNNGSGRLEVKYGKVGDLTTVKLDFNFAVNDTRKLKWTLTSLKLTYAGTIKGRTVPETTVEVRLGDYRAPLGSSFHCSDPGLCSPKANESAANLAGLIFKGIQIQFSKKEMSGFGPAVDCGGTFTVPILSGVLISLFLAFLLGIGIMMLSSIKTMDQFDDPKGKQITVHTSEK